MKSIAGSRSVLLLAAVSGVTGCAVFGVDWDALAPAGIEVAESIVSLLFSVFSKLNFFPEKKILLVST